MGLNGFEKFLTSPLKAAEDLAKATKPEVISDGAGKAAEAVNEGAGKGAEAVNDGMYQGAENVAKATRPEVVAGVPANKNESPKKKAA